MNTKDNLKYSKKERQDLIIKLISENPVETQGQLTSSLIENGFDVTQATVSRDIKELRLIKISDKLGRYCYALPEKESEAGVMGRYSAVLRHAAVSVKEACNIVVLKTIPGSAQGCAVAIETLKLDNIIGLIAGDDTIFIATEGEEQAKVLASEIEELIY